jgi:hypothetical protein
MGALPGSLWTTSEAIVIDSKVSKPDRRRLRFARSLFRAVGSLDLNPAVSLIVHDPQTPGITAHLAVLYDRAMHIRLEINLDFFSTVRTHHKELCFHVDSV